ncbi:hypothetical protein [Desulfuromonas thiophila]|uniref:hypothetical protein n=1 Tax=Desulfuromonas thiophila TaxID=57664 RepID=UPI0024A92169|nr:hypothetical protein [Desulfuromonas thiophila]
MPHVVLEQTPPLRQVFEVLRPETLKDETRILKLGEGYLNAAGSCALIEALAIEAGRQQSFFIQLAQKPASLTVRLLPLTDPDKTAGVKTLLALVARQVRQAEPTVCYGKTNLQDFLLP